MAMEVGTMDNLNITFLSRCLATTFSVKAQMVMEYIKAQGESGTFVD